VIFLSENYIKSFAAKVDLVVDGITLQQ